MALDSLCKCLVFTCTVVIIFYMDLHRAVIYISIKLVFRTYICLPNFGFVIPNTNITHILFLYTGEVATTDFRNHASIG